MGKDWPTDTLGEKLVYYTLVLPAMAAWKLYAKLRGYDKE